MPSRQPRAPWLLLALSALLATPAAADPPGFAFLEVPGGARAAALGGAYASLARGAEAAFWNPAGLGQFEGSQFTATHTVTQAEIDAGTNIVNVATADSNETGPDTDDASVPVATRSTV